MTVRDLIKGSLKLAGIISSVQTPNAGEYADGFSALNMMLDSWSNENLAINKYVREVFPLVAGQSRYSIGDGGDWDTVRPMIVEAVTASDLNIVVTELTPFIPGDPLAIPDPIPDTPATYRTDYYSVNEMPVDIMNIQQWGGITSKTLQSDYVQRIYAEGNSPLEYINVYPVPASAKALVLYSKKTITQFESVNDEIELPPGYEEAIKYNLAWRLAPEYGKVFAEDNKEIARTSIANIKRMNSKPVYLKSDAFGMLSNGRYNIFTGGYE